jgi:GT2 family glycosyltransferase
MKKKKIGIIILQFSNLKETLDCLESLQQVQTKHEIEVYLVVHGSKKVEIQKVTSVFPVIQILEMANAGFAGFNNIGIHSAINNGCEAFVLLNNDTIVDPHFLDPLIDAIYEPTVGFASPLIYFYSGKEFHRESYQNNERGRVIWYAGGEIDWNDVDAYHWGVDEVDHGQYTTLSKTQYATGCCMAFSKKTLIKIGFMDDRYFLYYEDADWSITARNKQLISVVVPKAKIWHKNAGSTQGPGSKLHQYYQSRNRILFAIKFAPWRSKIAVLRQAVRLLFSLDNVIRNAMIDALSGRYGKRRYA